MAQPDVPDLPDLSPTSSIPESSVKAIGPPSEHELYLERQAVRKFDYTIIPLITLFYLCMFLDRANIGNARVAGLETDLHLTDRQYQICVIVFFAPYIASELPASLLLKKIGPKLLLPIVIVTWGVVAVLQGFVTSYAGLIVARAFLGLAEGPMGPAIFLYLSTFYTRTELSLRFAMFFSAASLSGAFSGLLAAAIEKMDGIGGRPGWAWIFILEGLFTILLGIVSFFLVPSEPSDSLFLSKYEKELLEKRLERDRPSINMVDVFSFKEIVRALQSPHVILVCSMFFLLGMMLFGLAFFLPSLVNQLGFSPSKSQLLSVGPFAAGFFVTLITAYLSDYYAVRGIAMLLVSLLSISGFALYLGTEDKFTSYGALFLMVSGIFASIPVLSAWIANNTEPHYRRATAIALVFIASSSGGILSTFSFPSKDGPKFRKTTTMCLIFSIVVFMGTLINMAYLSWRNKLKKRPEVRAKLLEEFMTSDKEDIDAGINAWSTLGDRHPDFVYTL